ncbi:MAG: C25 family cysteine peptidase, partial [Bacteroidota bacterium]
FDGIYQMDYNFIKNELGANIDGVDVDIIKLYGNGGGMLPLALSETRIDDLQENAIEVVDANGNDQFDNGDLIRFVAQGANRWLFDETSRTWSYETNVYDEANYYFLKLSGEQGKRINSRSSSSNTTYTSDSFNDYQHFEEDKNNLLSRRNNINTQGTGKRWFGDRFEALREKDYNNAFNFPNIITTEPAQIRLAFAGRSSVRSRFSVTADGQSFTSDDIRSTNVTNSESTYAYLKGLTANFTPTSDQPRINVAYPQVSNASEGYLDFITINARRQLSMTGQQMRFADVNTLDHASTTFQLSNANANIVVWDVSDPFQPVLQENTLSGNILSFGTSTAQLKSFFAFDESGSFPYPTAIGKIAAQNVHGIDQVDMVIIYPEAYASAAMQLAAHRESYSQLSVATVEISQIFNEFSSGRQDPTAIRDFTKMLYDRSDRFRYLLLMGDGSFDYRNIYGENEVDDINHNSLILYETNQSLWNKRTPVHLDSDFYNMKQFLKGQTSLNAIELEALGDEVAGKSLLHLQCHFGQDTLSWARMGAHVTGMDFSEVAIEKAKSLSGQLQLPARFLQCNVYDLPEQLNEKFDIVFTSYGVLCWLHDLKAYAKIVARYLKPGGIFYIAEFHPVLYTFEWEQNKMLYDYFHQSEPIVEQAEATYTDGVAAINHLEYSWIHALSETMQPLLNEGLQLLEFKEFDYSPYNCFPNMKETAPGQYVYQGAGVRLPHVFSLKMQRQA